MEFDPLEPRVMLAAGLLQNTVDLPNGESTTFGPSAVVGDEVVYLSDFVSNCATLYDADTGQLSLITPPGIAMNPGLGIGIDGKALFTESYDPTIQGLSPAVDIYHSDTGLWSTASLSLGRTDMAVVGVGDMAIFAGGSLTVDPSAPSSAVDIFNAATNQWSISSLPFAADNMLGSSTGNDAVFSDGKHIQILDTVTSQWTSIALPLARTEFSLVAVGGYAIVAGGYYTDRRGVNHGVNSADVYDIASGSLSTVAISQGSTGIHGTTVGSKALFVAGQGNSKPRDYLKLPAYVFDSATGKFGGIDSPSVGAGFGKPEVIGNNVAFLGSLSPTTFVYDMTSRMWGTYQTYFGGPLPAVVGNQIVYDQQIFDYTESYPTQSALGVVSLSDASPNGVTPVQDESVSTQHPTFAWTPVAGSTSYDLYVDPNGGPEGPTASTSGTGYIAASPISAGKHMWEVTANTPGGTISAPQRTFNVSGPVVYPRIRSIPVSKTLTATTTTTAAVVLTNNGDLPARGRLAVRIVAIDSEYEHLSVLGGMVVSSAIGVGKSVVVHVPVSFANAPTDVFYIAVEVAPPKRSAQGGTPELLRSQDGFRIID
jgi:hypothetical protein